MILCCCRHPIAGAAAHARHQQEDGRGAEGHLRLLGEGATAPRRAQRSVSHYIPVKSKIYFIIYE